MHPTESKVSEALAACRTLLTEEEFREVSDMNGRHNEWGVAIELLADILGEKEAKISSEQLSLIESAFRIMALDPRGRIEHLRGFVSPSST